MPIRFEWDVRKSRGNVDKHGISFEEATTVFSDPLSRTIADPDHSEDEDRSVTVGLSHRQRLLVVVHVDDGEKRSGSSVPARRRDTSEKSMKKASKQMCPEYDFSDGVRGKYAKQYAEGTNVVVLDPDVSEVFSDSASVNRALRALAEVIHDQSSSKRAPKG